MLHQPSILAWFLGGWELAVIIVVGIAVLYAKRLPEIGRNVGKSIVEFKKGLSGETEEPKSPPATPAPSDQDSGKAS